MRKLLIVIGMLLVLSAPMITAAAPAFKFNRELAAVRQATAKFHNVDAAIAAGYVPTEVCTELPGQGGMGFHYVHPHLASDLQSDPLKPEVLLYAPADDGLKLVGVEYFQADAGQKRPTVLGQSFDGPMPGHEPGMPTHYDLHLWLWENNSNGLFAPWNPKIHC